MGPLNAFVFHEHYLLTFKLSWKSFTSSLTQEVAFTGQYQHLDRPISHAGGRLVCISISYRARKFFSTTQTLRTIRLHPIQLHKQPLHSYPIRIGLSPPIQASSSTRELPTARWCKIRASMCTSRPTVISASGIRSTRSRVHHLPSRAIPTRSTSRLSMASVSSLSSIY